FLSSLIGLLMITGIGLAVDDDCVKVFAFGIVNRIPKVDKKGHSAVSPVVIPLILKLRAYVRFAYITALNNLNRISIIDESHFLIIADIVGNQSFIIRHIIG